MSSESCESLLDASVTASSGERDSIVDRLREIVVNDGIDSVRAVFGFPP